MAKMEKEFEITMRPTDTTYGKALSNVQVLIFNKKSFRDEIIAELAEPTENTPLREEVLEWGPHGAWLCQALDAMYNESTRS